MSCPPSRNSYEEGTWKGGVFRSLVTERDSCPGLQLPGVLVVEMDGPLVPKD